MRSFPTEANAIRAIVEATRRDRFWLAAALLLAVLLHLLFASGIARLLPSRRLRGADSSTQVVYIDLPVPAAPLPPLPAASERAPHRPAPVRRSRSSERAQAGAVLTKEPDRDEPVDFTGQGFVIGSSSTYAGGFTSKSGTSRRAVLSNPRTVPAPTEPAVTPPDKSRRAAFEGGAQWHCPFPPEANEYAIDSAVVPIRVDLDATGSVRDVVVLSDPGHGFGREADRCARSKRFNPALDRDGTPIAAQVTIRVHFER